MLRITLGKLGILIWLSLSYYRDVRGAQASKGRKVKKVLSVPGDRRIDYYYWLNQRNNPKVLQYLKR